jgi:hypothetical protein
MVANVNFIVSPDYVYHPRPCSHMPHGSFLLMRRIFFYQIMDCNAAVEPLALRPSLTDVVYWHILPT